MISIIIVRFSSQCLQFRETCPYVCGRRNTHANLGHGTGSVLSRCFLSVPRGTADVFCAEDLN